MLLSKLHSRNHNTYFLRSLSVIVIALTLLLLQMPKVSAASQQVWEQGDNGESVVALDVLCVEGVVINHQEEPLSDWVVTATYVEPNGTIEPKTDVSNDSGKFYFKLDEPGRWQFSIEIPESWQAVTDATFTVDMGYGSVDCLDIRFKVQQVVEVIVLKIDDDHTPLSGWTIVATPGKNNPFNRVYKAVTDADGRATFLLPPGNWIFTEEAPANTTWWAPVMPVDGIQEFNVRAPGPYTIRFKNYVKEVKHGCIQVTKQDMPPDGVDSGPFGLPGWPITVLRADDTIAADGTTNAFGKITFSDLPFGPYVVRETMLDGWEPVTPTSYKVTLARTDEGCQEIIFTNKQKEKGFCFEGIKKDLKDDVGIPGWSIWVEAQETGDIVPDPVVTDGQGKFRIDFPFDDYRVPGSAYLVCEEIRDGWTSVSQTCYKAYLPKYPGKCTEIPPFVNRQTNEEFERPKTDYPQKHHYEGNKQWEPAHPGSCSAHHTVKRGESVSSIAQKYHASANALMRANPWVRSQKHHWLYVGQEVCIP